MEVVGCTSTAAVYCSVSFCPIGGCAGAYPPYRLQADADGAYGHVAVLEKINADGSIEISESNAKGLGVISTRTFSAAEAGKFQYVHY